MAIKVKKVTITTAEVLLLATTPKQLLAAPASGYVNNILSVTIQLDFNSVGYVSGGALNVYAFAVFHGSNNFFTDNNVIISFVQDILRPMNRTGSSIGTTQEATYLSCAADPTTGDSDLIAYIVYETKLIEV